jgi:hypothetical protein
MRFLDAARLGLGLASAQKSTKGQRAVTALLGWMSDAAKIIIISRAAALAFVYYIISRLVPVLAFVC